MYVKLRPVRQNALICRGYENNSRGVNPKISFVCLDVTIDILLKSNK